MRNKGFTLIELLVAIAIIALLLSILSSALKGIRESARMTLCRANIRELSTAIFSYEANNERLPYGLDNASAVIAPVNNFGCSYDRAGYYWLNTIEEFSGMNLMEKKMQKLAKCPSKKIENFYLQSCFLTGNYGVNESLFKTVEGSSRRAEFLKNPLNTGNIPKSSQTLMILDAGYAIINWWHATDSPPYPPGTRIEDTAYVPGMEINKQKSNLWFGQHYDAIEGRHPNKSINAGFADGHIEKLKAESLCVEKNTSGYENKIPLWSPK